VNIAQPLDRGMYRVVAWPRFSTIFAVGHVLAPKYNCFCILKQTCCSRDNDVFSLQLLSSCGILLSSEITKI
jgi:hypothetical protein